MQNSLIRGLNQTARTTNGMRANTTTFSNNVDFFFAAGASRGKDISAMFSKACGEDLDVAVRILQWTRDIRGGAGERKVFRIIVGKLARGTVEDQAVAAKLLTKIPMIGRWDDVLELMNTPLEADAARFIGQALAASDGLAAKWMPRKGPIAIKLRNYWGLSPRQYRKLLVTLTNVVETKMCAKDWNAIQFDKLPSLASARYQKAFTKNAPDAYAVYKAGLEKGTTTINAGAVYPYDITKSIRFGDSAVADAQWKAQPDYIQGSTERMIVVADVSDSMTCSAGGNANLTCMEVCISLAMYIAERGKGPFQNAFMTFSSSPMLQIMKGKTLGQRYNELARADWGMSTDLTKTFNVLLDTAVRNKVEESDMPTMILILSDMQFNQCARWDGTALQSIQRRYEAAGYKVPKLVFWNLNAKPGTNPATIRDDGVALVSGFSPAIMTSLLKGKDFSPEGMMLEAVRVPRYDWQ